MITHHRRPNSDGRNGSDDADRGSMSLELVVLAPVVIVLLLLVVAFGRVAHSRQLVESAAAAAARSASLASSPSEAAARAHRAAAASLADAGVSCRTMSAVVDSSGFRAGGEVTVAVSCTADLSDLALSGVPGQHTLTGQARSPLETYRPYGDVVESGTAP